MEILFSNVEVTLIRRHKTLKAGVYNVRIVRFTNAQRGYRTPKVCIKHEGRPIFLKLDRFDIPDSILKGL